MIWLRRFSNRGDQQDHDTMSREITTDIEIDGTAQAVWDILADFAKYPLWNSFLLQIRGTPRAGAWIRFRFELPRGFRAVACALILKAEAGRELRWAGGLPGIFRAEHYFIIERLNDSKLRFHHGEIFSGVVLSMVWPILRNGGSEVYEAMNVALKQRAEQRRASACP
jgi:hypothetical protein